MTDVPRCNICGQPISAHSVEQAIACEKYQIEAMRRERAARG